MNIGEKLKQSRAIFKAAVNFIWTHRLPVTPPNYELWYHYVNKTIPRLNQEIDATLEENGSISSFLCQQLHREYFAKRAEYELEQFKGTIEGLAVEAKNSMNSAVEGTLVFEGALDRIVDDYSQLNNGGLSVEELSVLIKGFVEESKVMKTSATTFKSQLVLAQEEIEKLQDSIKKLQREAMIDSLTGLPNRRAFDEDMHKLLDSERSFSLAVLDVDRFKSFNDTYGHQMGDRVLASVASRLRSPGIKGVKAYRIGGEEFAVIMPKADLKLATVICESLRKSIEKISIRSKSSNNLVKNITASFGVAYRKQDDSYETIVHRADTLLYKAKDEGRNKVVPE
ncbi:GGDEF domain-containing protein [Vibrio owensii]|uniref:GGDEF domain-containing protein n=1 Tax=Vibrio harveyi group TaxID=717610 RepID=UPI003CC5712D